MSSRRKNGGFTLIEVAVVVVIIAILATLGALGIAKYQTESLDAQRAANAITISEALEKYYDSNGEYPSCSQITQSPDEVSESVLIGISLDALKTPRGEGNSIRCQDLEEVGENDYFAYVGDESEACVGENGSACVLYSLKYIQESSQDIATIDSRRQTALSPDSIPTLTATTTGLMQIRGNFTSIPGAIGYDLQYSRTISFPNEEDPNTATSGTISLGPSAKQTTITSLQTGSLYYLRVRAVSSAGPGNWSGTKTATTWSLAAPSVSTSSTSSSITASWGAVQHATGYTVEYANNSSMTGSVTVNTTSTSHTISVSAGVTRYIRVRATNGSIHGNWSSTVSDNTIPAPTAVTVTRGTETTSSVAFSWPSQAYATSYQYQSRINAGSWSGLTTTTSRSVTISSSNAARVDLRVRVVNPSGTSDYSNVATGYLIPPAPTVSYGTVTTTTLAFSWTSIPNVARYESQHRTNSGSWNTVVNEGTITGRTRGPTTEGTRIDMRVRAVSKSGTAGAWSAANGRNLLVTAPAWNKWNRTENFPSWQQWVSRSDGGRMCADGITFYSSFRDGVSPSWNAWRAYVSHGTTATGSSKYTSTINNFTSTLQSQIRGYCRNASSGAVSSTKTTSVYTTKHTAPNVTLSAPKTCSGTYSGRDAYQLRLTVNEVSYNLNANTSNVTWSLYRYAAKAGWKSFDQTKTWPWAVNINGVTGSGSSNSSYWRTRTSVVGQTEGIASGTVTVAHNSDGRKTINFSGSDGPGSNIFGSGSCSSTYVLSDLR